MASFSSLKSAIFEREHRKQQYQNHIRGLNAYDRHKKLMNDYSYFYKDRTTRQSLFPVQTDQDTLREGYRFIRTDEDDSNPSWEQRLVKSYYDKLFKEYCVADLSHYKAGKIGLRWRTEKEVISGKGQFICGNRKCDERQGLASYEVNFAYLEVGENKQALVKVVACDSCAEKLKYKRNKEKVNQANKELTGHKRKRGHRESESSELGSIRTSDDHRRGKESTSSRRKANSNDTDDNFDEYLEDLYPKERSLGPTERRC